MANTKYYTEHVATGNTLLIENNLYLNRTTGQFGFGVVPDQKVTISGSLKMVDGYQTNGRVITDVGGGVGRWMDPSGVGSNFPVIFVENETEFVNAFSNYNSENGTLSSKGAWIVLGGDVTLTSNVTLNHSGIIVDGATRNINYTGGYYIIVTGDTAAALDYRNVFFYKSSTTDAVKLFDVKVPISDTNFYNCIFNGICANASTASSATNYNIYYELVASSPTIIFNSCYFATGSLNSTYHRFILYSSASSSIVNARVISHSPDDNAITTTQDRTFEFALPCTTFRYLTDGSGQLYGLAASVGSSTRNIKNTNIPHVNNPVGSITPTMNESLYYDNTNKKIYFSTGVTAASQWLRILTDADAASGSTVEKTFSWVIGAPTVGGIPGPKLKVSGTVTKISSFTTAATSCVFNIERRASSTPNTAGTNILTSDQTSSTTGTDGTTFDNSGAVSANEWLWLDIATVNGNPGILTVTIAIT